MLKTDFRQGEISDALLMDTRDLARVLGVGVHQLEQWRRRGEGPPFLKLTRKSIRYRRADVEAWLAARVIDPKSRRDAA